MSHHLKILQRNLQKIEYEGLLDRLETPLKKFQKEILQSEVSNTSEINAIYSELLGVGQGSTPQSDDIFLGVITMMSIIKPEIKEKFLQLATIRYENFTTKKSCILIRKFLRGNFPVEVQKLITLFKVKNQQDKFERELRKVKMVGASSGMYFLVGLLWQIQYYEKSN
ncbi:MAG: oxamate carbamoyltransferase subunit AllH family protein [Candidatus Hodarchaeales archaeon]